MHSVAIGIQCRLSSTRLPAKALLSLLDSTLLGICIHRAKLTNLPVYVLTSRDSCDDLVELEAIKFGCTNVIRGDSNDVMSRYCTLGNDYGYDYLIRVTADNPLTDFRFIDDLLLLIQSNQADYVSVNTDLCPKGTSLEVFSTPGLSRIHASGPSDHAREHVTTDFIQRLNPSDLFVPTPSKYFDSSSSKISFTIDTLDDYLYVYKVSHSVALHDPMCWLNADFVTKCISHVSPSTTLFSSFNYNNPS